MRLKKRLIQEIEQLPVVELIIIQNLVQMLTRHRQPQPTAVLKRKRKGYLETRKALAACQGNLSDDIIQDREDRI
jgi:hypothetical protein